jgi:hypothetical protein
MLGGVDHYESGLRFDVGRALADQLQRNGVPHGLLEGIVAAGVQQDELQLARAGDRGDHLLQRHRLRLGVIVGCEPAQGRHRPA